MAYYKRLKELREDNDYTQKQLADILFTTQPQYYRYESGKRELPCDLLVILAKHYKVSAYYILGLSDKKRSVTLHPFRVPAWWVKSQIFYSR